MRSFTRQRSRTPSSTFVGLNRPLSQGDRALVPQAKLTVNRPGDVYEQEADRVAEQVMRMEQVTQTGLSTSAERLQRMCAECEEEEELQRLPQPGGQLTAADSDAAHLALRDPGRPLTSSERDFFEPRMGFDFSRVRIHSNDRADAAARSVAARAYTLGSDIVMRSREYAPGTDSGRRLLAHELTHVIQQSGQGGTTRAIQRQESEEPSRAPATTTTCSITAKREPRGSGFCITGTTNAPRGTRVSFHYVPGMTSCNRGDLAIMGAFGTTTVGARGKISWTAPTNVGSPIPGVGRLFGAIVGSATCCTRPVSGSC